MKKQEWNEGLDHIDADLVENYVRQKEKIEKNKKSKTVWLRIGALAACFALIVVAVAVAPMFKDDEFKDTDNNKHYIPIVNMQTPSFAPQYYGNDIGDQIAAEVDTTGMSVTAELIEILPNTYTFFDDWMQYEFRLLRMKTLTVLKGKEMTDEFYYIIPVDCMTDYSVFDKFVIIDMAQYTYEYSVLYNKSQGSAEKFSLVIFGYSTRTYTSMFGNFMAFDKNGKLAYAPGTAPKDVENIWQAEEKARKSTGRYHLIYVHLLKDIKGEAKNILSQISSFENGIYVPAFSSNKLYLDPEVQFRAVRYINGFATNEKVNVWCKEYSGGDKDTYAITQARFTKDDMNALPDLVSAMKAVVASYKQGSIKPPHLADYKSLKLNKYGIFGWYAKTPSGVVGIVRVTWRYINGATDDAYYIIEYGSNECVFIDRDALLDKLDGYEATYIYTGEYNENGKVRDTFYPPI